MSMYFGNWLIVFGVLFQAIKRGQHHNNKTTSIYAISWKSGYKVNVV